MLDFYKCFKNDFEYEKYLDMLPHSLRCCFFSKNRLPCHPLRIQIGRCAPNRIARNERICIYCDSYDIEDEYHFICVCKKVDDFRKKLIKKYYYVRPSMFKLIQLIQSSNYKILHNLCLFIRKSLK